MSFSPLTDVIWIASVMGNLSLLAVLCAKARWKSFPVFTMLAAFEVIRSVLLFSAASRNRPDIYYWTYWITEALDISLEVAVLWELTRNVFLASSRRNANNYPGTLGKVLVLLALLLAIGFSSLLPGVGSTKQIVDMHASVFTSLLTCELYLLFSASANQLGINRKQHVMAISNGLALMSVISLALNTVHQILGWTNHPVMFDQIQSTVATFILFYWTRSLWYADGLKPKLWPSLARTRFVAHDALRPPLASERS